jgi:hypothetical protein
MDDRRVRAAAFDWLVGQVDLHGDVLSRSVLAEGFVLDGERVPLVGPQGIFKPRVLREAPLSITTAPDGPYSDVFPSFDEAKAWYDSPAYREVREHRFRGADYRAVIVEGLR